MESVFSTLLRGRMCYWTFVSFVCVAAFQSNIAACQQSCQPECTAVSSFVPDPLNCTRFYYCLADGPADAPLTCPNGEFNPVTASCEPGDPANPCTALCPVPQCSFKCNLTGSGIGFVRDPYDCGMFHLCTQGGTFGPFKCQAEAPYFNGEICVEKEDVCCTQGCRPFCEPHADLAPDPLDCTKYYNCSADSGAPLSCLEGSTFDPAIGQCVEGRPCRDCGGGPGATAASTVAPAKTTTTATTKAPPTTTAPATTTTTTAPATTTTTTAPATTTTTTAPATTTTTTTAPPPCNVPEVCTEIGNFPICNFCHERYYYCPRVGAKPSVMKCINDLVFNTVPSYRYCILKEKCPFTPSE
nr:spore coat protein SP65-like [Penaeus vannamei]